MGIKITENVPFNTKCIFYDNETKKLKIVALFPKFWNKNSKEQILLVLFKKWLDIVITSYKT